MAQRLIVGDQVVSSSNRLPVSVTGSVATTDTVATGNITTQNLTNPTGTGTAGSYVALTGLNGASTCVFQVTGVYTGALTVQGTIDGTNWVSLGLIYNIGTNTFAATVTSASTGLYMFDTAGLPTVRVTGLAAMTGTAVVTMEASSGVMTPPKIGITGAGGSTTIDGAINSTAPTNVVWVAPSPTTVSGGACSAYFQTAETVHNVKATGGSVYGFAVQNTSAAVAFLQLYNTSGTPTLGTSVIWSVPCIIGVTIVPPSSIPLGQFATGIGIGFSTTASSTGTPSVAPVVTLWYK